MASDEEASQLAIGDECRIRQRVEALSRLTLRNFN